MTPLFNTADGLLNTIFSNDFIQASVKSMNPSELYNAIFKLVTNPRLTR